jgi:cytochrome c-type biogenesis protein CcmH
MSSLGNAFAIAALLGASVALGAGQVDVYEFPDEAIETRYRALIREFRCPKCLNTNLAGSDAPIAKDLRRTVRRLVVADGMGDAEIRRYLQDRYGDFVLYDPPFRPDTWILWITPGVLVVIGAAVLIRVLRRPAPEPLAEADRARVRTILDDP